MIQNLTHRSLLKHGFVALSSLLAIVAIFVFVMASSVTYFLYTKVDEFSQNANVSVGELKEVAKQGWHKQLQTENGRFNILVLGIDSLPGRGESPPLTDTMIFVSIDTTSGRIDLLSLPRDLWSADYQTKINALYYYGQEKDPTSPEKFPTDVISEMLNMPVHRTTVISMDSIASLIDLIGGLEIDVPTGFTDELFPRTDVDVTVERDPAKLYKTVTFEKGRTVMSGETTLEYIRSRHSDSGVEGSDTARSERQQLVINSLMAQLMREKTLANFALLGKLYQFYQLNFAKYISTVDVIALLKSLAPHREQILLKSHYFSIWPDDDKGVIWHPPERRYAGQWVFVIKDDEKFQVELNEFFALY